MSSRFKGVHFNKTYKKFGARIYGDSRQINLGLYPSELIAAKVYDRHALKYYGEFACCNTYTAEEEAEWNKVSHLYDKDFVPRVESSRFVGVVFVPKGKYRLVHDRWRTSVDVKKHNGKNSKFTVGTFDTELEGAYAFNLCVTELDMGRELNVFTDEELKEIELFKTQDNFIKRLSFRKHI